MKVNFKKNFKFLIFGGFSIFVSKKILSNDNKLKSSKNRVADYKISLQNQLSDESLKEIILQEKIIPFASTLKFNNHINNIKKTANQFIYILRDYLNKLTLDVENDDQSFQEADVTNLVNELIETSNLIEKSLIGKDSNGTLKTYLFTDLIDVELRILSLIAIQIKNGKIKENQKIKEKIKNFIENNIEYYVNNNYDDHLLQMNSRVLINLENQDHSYLDILLELNRRHMINKIKKDEFDFDIIFISGLNSSYFSSWRKGSIDFKKTQIKHYIEYYLFGLHKDLIFQTIPSQIWISEMMEENTFKGKNIRYITATHETRTFLNTLLRHNIPDYSIDEISKKALKEAKVGEKPTVIISHSMGGLITKNILNKAKEDKNEKMLENIKGIIYFSTPHFGSDAVEKILQKGVRRYLKFFRVVESTGLEYGQHDEDIYKHVSDIEFSKACNEICFKERQSFEKEHEEFKKLNIDYICINESDPTYIKEISEKVFIVSPNSANLPETFNLVLKNKIHSNIQKFSNVEDEGYLVLIDFIKKKLKLL